MGRYVESIIQQECPTFEDGEVQFEADDLFMSRQPICFKKKFDVDYAHQLFKSSVFHVVSKIQMHDCKEVCFKYGSKTCRFNYPRPKVPVTDFTNGVIQLKRLDNWCNNYNRAVSAVVRCNTDFKFITNGQDARAAIFYTTDYITKTELSAYESVSLIKLALDKIDQNLYPRKADTSMSDDENRARRRIFTVLNVLDAHVERQAQWCVHSLMGRPLEYKSHRFCSFNAYNFVNFVNETSMDTPSTTQETTIPMFPANEYVQQEMLFVNRRIDYMFRCPASHPTDRFKIREKTPLYLFKRFEDSPTTLAQMSPYEYHFRVEKKVKDPQRVVPADDEDPNAAPGYELLSSECLFNSKHPQYTTHVQHILDVSNRKKPHAIPTMFGYMIPDVKVDPDKYYLAACSLFTPFQDPQDVYRDTRPLVNGEVQSDGKFKDLKSSHEAYMESLSFSDPIMHAWVLSLLENSKTIREGRDQQKLERAERERLLQEQDLVPDEPDGPYNYAEEDADVDNQLDESVLRSIVGRLPEMCSSSKHHKQAKTIQLLASDDQLHPSRHRSSLDARNPRAYGTASADFKIELESTLRDFTEMLNTRQNEMYCSTSRQDNPHPFRSILTICEGLDTDQTQAVLTIANQILKREMYNRKLCAEPPEQMIMYLGGEGGTGKSKVLRAVTDYMTGLGIRHKLRIAAETGVAAGNVGGSTLHSLLKLVVHEKDKKGKPKEISQGLVQKLQGVELMFIDEVSMTGCTMMQRISTQLSNAKSNMGSFGGVDMIFAGDFYQLPPTNNDPLYRKPSVEANVHLTKSSAGFLKFQQITDVVFLRTQHRIKDNDYKDFVQRFRHGDQTVEDENYCICRKITPSNSMSKGHLKDLPADPIIIVKNNDFRYHLNNLKAKQHAKACGQKLLVNVARDSSKNPVENRVRLDILQLPESHKTGYGAGLLPMFRGMPVMIKKNIATELGVSNGSTGVITNIILDPRETVNYQNDSPHYLIHHPHAVYVCLDTPTQPGNDHPDVKIQLPGLPPNVFIMSTQNSSKERPMQVKYTPPYLPCEVKMTRRQYWFLPAYAITVNASQGRTLTSAIVHLDGNFKDNAKCYVMLSRVTNGSSLGIIGNWKPQLWATEPNKIMLQYVERQLTAKADHNLHSYDELRTRLPTMEQSLRAAVTAVLPVKLHERLYENFVCSIHQAISKL